MANIRIRVFILTLFVLLCTSCDLSTKWLAKTHLQHSPPITIISNFAEFHYTENDAIAFSMLQSIQPNIRKWIIYSLSSIALVFLSMLIWQVRNDSVWWLLALMLVLSGALGNLFERIARGYVVDFIHLHYYNSWSWPVFNMADIFITCGAILLGILMIRKSPDQAFMNISN